ncbi:hypothetical protein K469DRAFT_586984 [Zopfia rhizophila CBS 207.26]|uniref:Endosomal peripheral membrane protein-like protein n=1 Tax=Zopfia rhizophila CBS 207.26 TaxID=1314779 RepID=A0A6A6DRJ8_9PEZI|nr:hypothetical protein K469DRAFT_586984 [Zopfia rhizophila CBS 207.26]
MTAQILASELGNLIQDSKRKNSELRNAAEKALQDLKALPVTSEAQLAAGRVQILIVGKDLSRRPHFISPFLIACSTQNAKFGSPGVSCLQRLSVARALPKERLTEVLEALRDSVTLSNDVQLKILQALPSLLQNYPSELRGELLSIALQICSALQNAKNFAVSNTAAATLQQLVIFVFDRVSAEDERALEIPTVAEVTGDTGPVTVRPAAHDAYKVFNDLNLIVNGENPTFIHFSSIPQTSGLELIEAVLSNHGKVISTHAEQAQILRSLLMPRIIRALSDRLPFPVTVRIIRILYLLIRYHLAIMPSECEIALGLLNHMLDPEASPLWKRALCLEVFRGVYLDSRLVLEMYGQFDEKEGKRCIFGDNLAAFVRLATERPAIIGLGQHSTIPMGRGENRESASEQAVAEAGALAGVIGGPMPESNQGGNHTGISTQWSSLKTPCMEHLDKVEPPSLPDTYIYSLVLTCITNLSESLAKFVLPLTVPHEGKSRKKAKTEDLPKEGSDTASPSSNHRRLSRTQSYRKKSVPINPLTLTDHLAHSFIRTTSSLVSECWPAVLATCSTFLNAALDTEYYRALVRAIQKFTQVAGLLRLSTPRDAFLTTLAKAAVPPNLLVANVSSPKTPTPENQGPLSNTKGLLSVDSLVSQASSMSLDKNRRPSHEATTPTLSPRNLLCLRALINLAIALGPTLQSAWSIVFETLQMADLVMAVSNYQSGGRTPGVTGVRTDADSCLEKVEAETSAVQAAARRLFESTVDFPNECFVELLQALCTLLNGTAAPESVPQTPTASIRPQMLHQRRMGSVSGISLNIESNARDSVFALSKISELAALNEGRLCQYNPADSGWKLFVTELVRCCAEVRKPASARLLAADILSRTIREIVELSMADDQRNEIQTRILSALQLQISALHDHDSNSDDSYDDTDVRIHQIALETLKNVIEQCGESLVAGWDSVFTSLLSVFASQVQASGEDKKLESAQNEYSSWSFQPPRIISRQLARSAFGSVQLVCSDFLAAVPDKSLSTLLELLLRFTCQQEDLNMSLTTITFFWNVSDFLHSRSDLSSLPGILSSALQEDGIRHTIDLHSRQGSMPMLWLQVLMNLSTVTTDDRAELRNSAVQTIQRIFENYVDQLSSESWMLCLRTVLFRMVEVNLTAQRSIRSESRATPDETAAWNESTKIVLGSISLLISTYMDKINNPAKLGDAWSDLLQYLQQYFTCGSHALGSSVFTTITGVLSKIERPEAIGEAALLKTASMWKSYFDHCEAWQDRSEGNQEAFVAYAEAFKAIYRLTHGPLGTELPSMLSNLEQCIVQSSEVAYSSDIDHMTPLQTQVLECFSMIRSDSAGLPPFLIKMLSRLSILPYSSKASDSDRRSPTFVALSKASMTLLQATAVTHINDGDVYSSGAFHFALGSLFKPIQEKYIWQREGKPPTIWQKATTTALAILEPGLSYITSHNLKGEAIKGIWTQVVNIACGITSAGISPATSTALLEKDEAFDMDAFGRLRDMITLSLGSSAIPDALRRTYTRTLFEVSVIHEPEPGEVPNLMEAPLEDLYRIRFGHTYDHEPTLRSKMAYVCLSELISLVSVHDGSTERIKLAQAAAPYLILRITLPLRAYIADQPLRGRMPAPESHRRELLFVLGEMRKLKSEPQAIPDAPGVTSTHKKHLHRLYPLLVQATKVARNDAAVFEGLAALMDMVGKGFGLQDE